MSRFALLICSLAILAVGGACCKQPGDKVQFQLKWVVQAQFAGYYAAKAKGLYLWDAGRSRARGARRSAAVRTVGYTLGDT